MSDDLTLQDLLLIFSEWLDTEGLLAPPTGEDARTHDDLAAAFLAQWTGAPLPLTLAAVSGVREPEASTE